MMNIGLSMLGHPIPGSIGTGAATVQPRAYAESPAAAQATQRCGVLIAYDHRLLAEALAVLLAQEFTVLGCVSDGEALIAAARNLRPDIALIDVNMSRMNGLEPGQALRRLLPSCRLVYLSAEHKAATAGKVFAHGAAVLNASGSHLPAESDPPHLASDCPATADPCTQFPCGGAFGFLPKSCSGPELIQTLRTVRDGGIYLSSAIARGGPANLPPTRDDPVHHLSPREREVLRLAARGATMKEIARTLSISPRTVAFHKYRGMTALKLQRRADLVQFALKHGMMRDPPHSE
ncbi:MAG TPA: response regulator transcription factor [Rhodocyclaceae bacterium]|nr:response regulator transcription factor [Rhodocyclaceae bacterium]